MAMQYQDMADLIGAESCLDFGPDPTATLPHGGDATRLPRWPRRSNAAAALEYPPVIPSLSRPTTKYCTEDGRLVIKEEKVDRPLEYLRAHRSDGRLVLNLVPLDGAEDEISDGDDVATPHSDKGKGIAYGEFAAAVAAAVAVAELRPPVLTGETF